MPSRILIAVDGSAFSRKAVKEAAKLARRAGSRLVLFHVAPDCRSFPAEALSPPGRLRKVREQARRRAESRGQAALAAAAKASAFPARRIEKRLAVSESPYAAIIAAARRCKCDLVVMASRGRRAVSGMVLGSETQKVLSHSKVPVLVVR